MVPISNGQTVTESLDDRQWIFYDISTSNTDSAITFSVIQNNIVSDCDLYIQYDSFPSKSDFYQKDTSRDSTFNIKIDNPGNHLWYAGVYGFFDCSYSMTVNVESQRNFLINLF